MHVLKALVIVLVVVAVGYLAFLAGRALLRKAPPGPLSPNNFPSWFKKPSEGGHNWNLSNHPYYNEYVSQEACRAGCEADPNCLTLGVFRTRPDKPTAPCQYWDKEAPASEIITYTSGTWEGSLSTRAA